MPLYAINGGATTIATTDGNGATNEAKIFPSVVLSNLTEFRKKIGDVARGYFFQISIPSIDDNSESLTMMAKSTILPAYALEDKGFEFQGSRYKQAGHATFDDWNVTFLADEYHKLRHKFLSWQSLIFDPIRQIPFASGSYKKNGIKVLQLSKDGLVVSGYEFYGMYPSRVSEIQLSQSGEIEEFTVTFSYDYFTINGDNNQGADFTSITNSNGVYAVSVGTKFAYADATTDKFGGNRRINQAVGSFDDETPLEDKAGNKEIDYNGMTATTTPPGGVLGFLQNLNPLRGYDGDINTADPAGFLDYANWMSFRYSPPLRFRIRNYLPDSVNNATNLSLPPINPYDALGI
jgi:hypothetical protein